jgi:hypothetical protein
MRPQTTCCLRLTLQPQNKKPTRRKALGGVQIKRQVGYGTGWGTNWSGLRRWGIKYKVRSRSCDCTNDAKMKGKVVQLAADWRWSCYGYYATSDNVLLEIDVAATD